MQKTNFFSDIEILEQRVLEAHYSDRVNNETNVNLLDSELFEINIEYDLYINNQDDREHYILIALEINEKNQNDEDALSLNILTQGHYKIKQEVKKKEYDSLYHFGSLSLGINHLRLAFFNLTSLTLNTGQSLPLVNMSALHEAYDKKIKKLRAKEKK
ncbi:hypothetical protein [Winogradskyella sp. MH6]|uniref:hypothetical protein n=1 Tax=Winogradskyella sp. MH6 TaxID=2929510 RepID=UPI001FB3685C|nr:hypothetical protein [Winogradskyella sp. MH6]